MRYVKASDRDEQCSHGELNLSVSPRTIFGQPSMPPGSQWYLSITG